MPDSDEMRMLQVRLAAFADARDWQQFHDPKNLSMALVVEAGELVEIFQWLTSEQATSIMEDPKKSAAVKEELADVYGYLLRLADILGISLNDALEDKIALNAEKYPVEMAKGNATKYTELHQPSQIYVELGRGLDGASPFGDSSRQQLEIGLYEDLTAFIEDWIQLGQNWDQRQENNQFRRLFLEGRVVAPHQIDVPSRLRKLEQILDGLGSTLVQESPVPGTEQLRHVAIGQSAEAFFKAWEDVQVWLGAIRSSEIDIPWLAVYDILRLLGRNVSDRIMALVSQIQGIEEILHSCITEGREFTPRLIAIDLLLDDDLLLKLDNARRSAQQVTNLVGDETIPSLRPVRSSQLAAASYDDSARQMYVMFREGSLYRYSNISRDVYRGLLTAESHGSYLAHVVKDAGYEYERLA